MIAQTGRVQRGAAAADNRINDRIRAPQVRLIGADGSQVGVIAKEEALRMAVAADLDLVEVAPNADPPVCKIMDYGKFKYQESIRAKEARKKQGHQQVKEIRFGPKIGDHDYQTKRNRVVEFLEDGHRVKVSVRFKGREMHHTELGAKVLRRLVQDLDGTGAVEVESKLDGRIMTMMFSPVKKRPEKAEKPEKADAKADADVKPEATEAKPEAVPEVTAPPPAAEEQAVANGEVKAEAKTEEKAG